MVRRVEGSEPVRAHLRGPASAQQPPTEVQTNLGDVVASGDEKRCDQVLAAVVADLAERDLRAGDEHRLPQPVQHERQRGCRVSHRVGTVKDDEPIVIVIVRGDVASDLDPLARRHVRRVEQRLILVDRERRNRRVLELGHGPHLLLQIARLRRVAVPGPLHPDRAARVSDVDALLHSSGDDTRQQELMVSVGALS